MVAQENKVTRRVSKTAVCIPEGSCENKKQGLSSTEVVFQVYEDGSTSEKYKIKDIFCGYNLSEIFCTFICLFNLYERYRCTRV